MSNAGKFIERISGGALPDQHINSLKDLSKIVTNLPAEAKNFAADAALNAAGIDITALLDRLTPAQKVKVMAWAMRQGAK